MVPAVRATAAARPSAPSKGGGPDRAVPPTPSDDDIAETIAERIARRTELLMVAQHGKADAREFEIDRLRTDFDLHEQERAEFLREWNVTRDLAMEQMKKDDENVKKWIALI